MQFSCEKAILLSALSITSRAVASKSSIPALEGILLEAGESLCLTGYNLETGIRTTVHADITEKGILVLSARLFLDIVRKLPDDVITLSSEGYLVKIQCGMAQFNILATNAEEFPELPSVQEKNFISIKQSTLRDMIAQTLFSISDNDSRPIHTGSLFEVTENNLTIVSVDGYRLALRKEKVETAKGAENISFVVPGNALSEVERICTSDEDTIDIIQDERHISFRMDNILLVCRRLEGEFLAYNNAIPRNNKIILFGDGRSLVSSIERVSLLISEKLKSPLRCIFGENTVTITTKTGLGDATDNCPLEGDGENLEIGFNNRYLLEAIKAAPSQKLKLELSSPVSPCIILPAEGEENFIYMVLPVRLRTQE